VRCAGSAAHALSPGVHCRRWARAEVSTQSQGSAHFRIRCLLPTSGPSGRVRCRCRCRGRGLAPGRVRSRSHCHLSRCRARRHVPGLAHGVVNRHRRDRGCPSSRGPSRSRCGRGSGRPSPFPAGSPCGTVEAEAAEEEVAGAAPAEVAAEEEAVEDSAVAAPEAGRAVVEVPAQAWDAGSAPFPFRDLSWGATADARARLSAARTRSSSRSLHASRSPSAPVPGRCSPPRRPHLPPRCCAGTEAS
jgi:hypothetical protein